MKVSTAGRASITAREGEVLHTYYDSRNVLPGSGGHTGRMAPPKLTPGMTITKAMSDEWLAADPAPVRQGRVDHDEGDGARPGVDLTLKAKALGAARGEDGAHSAPPQGRTPRESA